jgi:hypothetical protein
MLWLKVAGVAGDGRSQWIQCAGAGINVKPCIRLIAAGHVMHVWSKLELNLRYGLELTGLSDKRVERGPWLRWRRYSGGFVATTSTGDQAVKR